MEAIIIAGMPATGKTVVAKIISKRLEIPFVDGGDMMKEMAKERGYNPGGKDWWDTAEGMRFLQERNENPNFDKEVDKRMKSKIEAGDVVVTSWPAPWTATKGFKVWLSASSDIRAQRMAERDHIDVEKMKRIVDERDRKNRKLYMALYKIDLGKDLKPFDLIVETDDLNSEQVADMILSAFNKREM